MSTDNIPMTTDSRETAPVGYTPGPWEVSQEPPRWIIQADGAIGKRAVAYMVGDFVQCAANARLIAAAPDLKAALTDLLAKYREKARAFDCPVVAKAEAALAKAEGRDHG